MFRFRLQLEPKWKVLFCGRTISLVLVLKNYPVTLVILVILVILVMLVMLVMLLKPFPSPLMLELAGQLEMSELLNILEVLGMLSLFSVVMF